MTDKLDTGGRGMNFYSRVLRLAQEMGGTVHWDEEEEAWEIRVTCCSFGPDDDVPRMGWLRHIVTPDNIEELEAAENLE
jgi:hypothetical protein